MDLVGDNLTPIPNDSSVLRLARLPKDFTENFKILAIQLDEEFTLSSNDKNSVPPHLSVWVSFLTTPEQAYGFLMANSSRKLILLLKAREIREVNANSGEGFYSNLLDVIWVYLFCKSNGEEIRDRRIGADGHSGITGLDEESAPNKLTKHQKKLLRKDLRAKLAELASKDYFCLPDM